MFDKLRQIEERYGELNRSLSDPQVIRAYLGEDDEAMEAAHA